MKKLSLRNLPFAGKRVLMRVDFNVPMNPDGTIADDARIRAALPSIEYVLQHQGRLILMSHLGRPKGFEKKLTLAPIAKRLQELLSRNDLKHRELGEEAPSKFCLERETIPGRQDAGEDKELKRELAKPKTDSPDCFGINRPVLFSSHVIGKEVAEQVDHLKKGEVLLLENLRFHAGEEDPEKEPEFVSALASLGDVYVNDAFGTAHRAHSSTCLIAKFFPTCSAMGFLMEKELDALACLLNNPARPFFVIMGGAKISGKIGVIQNLLKTVDRIFLGGGMAYPFLKAKGFEVGNSLLEAGSEKIAHNLLSSSGHKIELPTDLVIADGFSNDAKTQVITLNQGIPPHWQGMDIGPETVRAWSASFQKAATLFWNGPVGVYEMPQFMKGTKEIAKTLSQIKGKVVIGGGDSAAAVAQAGLDESSFYHISMGGGATLEYLEFGHLPGVDCLTNA